MGRVRIWVRATDVRGGVGQPQEEGLRGWCMPQEADRFSGEDVLLEVRGRRAVVNETAILVQQVVVDILIRMADGRLPRAPAWRHEPRTRDAIAIQVLPDQRRAITR